MDREMNRIKLKGEEKGNSSEDARRHSSGELAGLAIQSRDNLGGSPSLTSHPTLTIQQLLASLQRNTFNVFGQLQISIVETHSEALHHNIGA